MNFIRFGAMDVTKPCEFIRFGAMDVTKTCEFIRFGAMDVTKPCEFIGFWSWFTPVKFRCNWSWDFDRVPPKGYDRSVRAERGVELDPWGGGER